MSSDDNNHIPKSPLDGEPPKEIIPEPDWEIIKNNITNTDKDIQYDALNKARKYVSQVKFDIEKVFNSGIINPLVKILSDTLPDNNLVFRSVFNFSKE